MKKSTKYFITFIVVTTGILGALWGIGNYDSVGANYVDNAKVAEVTKESFNLHSVSLKQIEKAFKGTDDTYQIIVGHNFEEVDTRVFEVDDVTITFSEWQDEKTEDLHVSYYLSTNGTAIPESIINGIIKMYCNNTNWFTYEEGSSAHEFNNGEITCAVNGSRCVVNLGITITDTSIDTTGVKVLYVTE